jgi:hypothetical protein
MSVLYGRPDGVLIVDPGTVHNHIGYQRARLLWIDMCTSQTFSVLRWFNLYLGT